MASYRSVSTQTPGIVLTAATLLILEHTPETSQSLIAQVFLIRRKMKENKHCLTLPERNSIYGKREGTSGEAS